MKVKGGLYCHHCDVPVAAQKSTHRMRNIASTAALPATLGASSLGMKRGKWHCPNCGGAVSSIDRETAELRRQQQQEAMAALGRGIARLSRWSVRVPGRSYRWFMTRPRWAQIAMGSGVVGFLAIPS